VLRRHAMYFFAHFLKPNEPIEKRFAALRRAPLLRTIAAPGNFRVELRQSEFGYLIFCFCNA
jgi:hypothetical protein